MKLPPAHGDDRDYDRTDHPKAVNGGLYYSDHEELPGRCYALLLCPCGIHRPDDSHHKTWQRCKDQAQGT